MATLVSDCLTFLVPLSRRLKRTIVIMLRPSSVIVNLSYFPLLLWNCWTELNNLTGSKISMSSTKFVFFGRIRKTRLQPWTLIGWDIFHFSSETAEWNSIKLNRKQDLNVLFQGCVFRADKKTRWRPGFWLAETFSTSPLKPLNRNKWNLTGMKISTSSTKFVFFGQSKKQDGSPGFWFAETFSNSPLKLLNGIQRNLTGRKISTSSTKFVFFGQCGKKKMAALASDWLRHFRLLLWNRLT